MGHAERIARCCATFGRGPKRPISPRVAHEFEPLFPQISEGCVQLYRRAVMVGLPGHRRPWSSIAAGHTNAGAQSALFASMPAALTKPFLRLQLPFGFKGLCIVVVLVWLGATR